MAGWDAPGVCTQSFDVVRDGKVIQKDRGRSSGDFRKFGDGCDAWKKAFGVFHDIFPFFLLL